MTWGFGSPLLVFFLIAGIAHCTGFPVLEAAGNGLENSGDKQWPLLKEHAHVREFLLLPTIGRIVCKCREKPSGLTRIGETVR